jgi:histone deacetylase complex regulatory component SIN3
MSFTKRYYEQTENRRYTYSELLSLVKVLKSRINDLEGVIRELNDKG